MLMEQIDEIAEKPFEVILNIDSENEEVGNTAVNENENLEPSGTIPDVGLKNDTPENAEDEIPPCTDKDDHVYKNTKERLDTALGVYAAGVQPASYKNDSTLSKNLRTLYRVLSLLIEEVNENGISYPENDKTAKILKVTIEHTIHNIGFIKQLIRHSSPNYERLPVKKPNLSFKENGKSIRCYRCREMGHYKSKCTAHIKCGICFSVKHVAEDCRVRNIKTKL